ncbi:hypothetical protein Tco_0667823, partial [Tanacetum coccineum]
MLEVVASQDLWIWHAFYGMTGTNNDINVLDNSSLFDDLLDDLAHVVPYVVNRVQYRNRYYLADGIYPEWATVSSITYGLQTDPMLTYFKQRQESARKDVERAFGVLQGREYFDEADEEDENNHSNGNVVKRWIQKQEINYGMKSRKTQSIVLSFLGDMVREHIGLKILSWKKVDSEARDKQWDEITERKKGKVMQERWKAVTYKRENGYYTEELVGSTRGQFQSSQHNRTPPNGRKTVVGCENDSSIQKSNGLVTLEKEMETRLSMGEFGRDIYKKGQNQSKNRQSQAREWKEDERPKPKAFPSSMDQPGPILLGRGISIGRFNVRHFKTLSLDELRSPDFNLLSDQEYLEEEEAEAMAEIMDQYMSKTRIDYGPGVARPKIDNKDQFELKGKFLKELRENTFSGSDNEDANEHIEKVLEIVDLFHVPNITVDQLMLRVFPISLTGAASCWLRNEPTGSIKTWEALITKFLNKYCPPGRTAKKM